MENKREFDHHQFIKGLFCGVLLVLICMTSCIFALRMKMNKIAVKENKEETTDALELEPSRIEKKNREIEELVNQYYLNEIDTTLVEDAMYTGMIAGLDDPYSVYYTEEELKRMQEASSGEYSGIGVTLTQDPDTGALSVVSCFENTPAQEAGLLPGDVITGWNGISVDGWDLTELVSKIKTDPKAQMTLEILRDSQKLEVELVRRNVKVPTVESEMLDHRIGYIRLLEFDQVTEEQFLEAMEELDNQGMEKLIIDVRNNPGGILQVVCNMLDEMLPEGMIVYTEDKNGKRTEYYSDEEHQFTKPLAVLTNENSASASEIFAGAIQDYGIGTIVGTVTFGKGVTQKIFYLSDGTGLKLTTEKYFTPNGHDIHQKGIMPDVEISLNEEVKNQVRISHEEDNQLQEAIRTLQEE